MRRPRGPAGRQKPPAAGAAGPSQPQNFTLNAAECAAERSTYEAYFELIALSPDGEDLIRTSPVSLIPEGYGESDNWLDLMN